MEKICKNCGTKAEEDKSFCSVCGAVLDCKKNTCSAKSPLCKRSKLSLWIVSLVLQLLCVIMFFMPTVSVTVTVPGEYADKIPTISDLIKGEKSEDGEEESFFEESEDGQSDTKKADVDVLEGDFKLMNVIDFFGTEAYQTLCLFFTAISFVFFLEPLVRRRELKVHNALFALAAQFAFFAVNIVTMIVLKGKPISTIRKFADMIVFADIPEFIVNWLCETVESFYSYRLNLWGWMYMGFSVLSIAVLCTLVIANRKELKRKTI